MRSIIFAHINCSVYFILNSLLMLLVILLVSCSHVYAAAAYGVVPCVYRCKSNGNLVINNDGTCRMTASECYNSLDFTSKVKSVCGDTSLEPEPVGPMFPGDANGLRACNDFMKNSIVKISSGTVSSSDQQAASCGCTSMIQNIFDSIIPKIKAGSDDACGYILSQVIDVVQEKTCTVPKVLPVAGYVCNAVIDYAQDPVEKVIYKGWGPICKDAIKQLVSLGVPDVLALAQKAASARADLIQKAARKTCGTMLCPKESGTCTKVQSSVSTSIELAANTYCKMTSGDYRTCVKNYYLMALGVAVPLLY